MSQGLPAGMDGAMGAKRPGTGGGQHDELCFENRMTQRMQPQCNFAKKQEDVCAKANQAWR